MTPETARIELTSPEQRERLRYTRNHQWAFMERIRDAMSEFGCLWWCIWNKRRLPEGPGEYRMCLLSGMDVNAWVVEHPEWFNQGEWNDDRYAIPITLTEAGLEALLNRHLYDMEPVKVGLMEPGYIGIPAPRIDD